jgi:hypothetical protein
MKAALFNPENFEMGHFRPRPIKMNREQILNELYKMTL